MKVGDLVASTKTGVKNPPVGIILGFSLDFLINRYDNNQYRVFWCQSGNTTETWDYHLEVLGESR
tara:strand:+ start:42 stop:236 length:195 start_codon:yes stop_codon:yes gene_type:complete